MSQKYLFACSCGEVQKIEVSQAGQTIRCSCGRERQVPTMLNIKELQVAPEEPKPTREETGVLRQAFFYFGLVLLVPSLIFLVWSLKSYPQPRDVSRKKVDFVYGQTKVVQDSTPIPEFEHTVLWIPDAYFGMMSPIELFYYFKRLEGGPNFSYNFQENYQALKDAYAIRATCAAVLVAASLGCLVVSLFLPKRNVVVTGWSGTEWN